YDALNEDKVSAYGETASKQLELPVPQTFVVADAAVSDVPTAAEDVTSADEWEQSAGDLAEGTTAAAFRISVLGLVLTPTSVDSYGAWRSPILELIDPATGEARTELSTDRLYLLEARVGSTETDASRVPDFRLSVESASSDETHSLTIAN